MKNFFRTWMSRGSAAVRPEKRLQVVAHDPGRARRTQLLVTLLLAGIAVASFYLGVGMAARDIEILRSELITTKAENGELTEEMDILRRRVAILERGSWINREAAEDVRRELVQLRDEKNALNRDLSFYRNIMDPGNADQGVSIQRLELRKVSEGRALNYQWRFTVVQQAKQHAFQKGRIQVRVVGLNGEQQASHNLGALSAEFPEKGQDLGFRYFQSHPDESAWGTLELPKNFEPETLEVTIRLTSPARKVITKTYEWHTEE